MRCLILEGGGVKGLAHVGALNAMQDLDKVTHVAGSSAGSQVAALVAAGFTPEEMKETAWVMPLSKFLDSSWGYVRNVYRLVTKYGYCSGNYMEEYIDSVLSQKCGKRQVTFDDLFKMTGKHLKITGTCLNDGSLRWFDHELTPHMPVSKAVRLSSSVPLAFVPVVWEGETFVDGGCLRNLPINAFPGIHGIALDLVQKQTDTWGHTFTGFVGRVIDVILNSSNRTHDNPLVHVVKVDTGPIATLDFDLSEEKKRFLYKAGFRAVCDHTRK